MIPRKAPAIPRKAKASVDDLDAVLSALSIGTHHNHHDGSFAVPVTSPKAAVAVEAAAPRTAAGSSLTVPPLRDYQAAVVREAAELLAAARARCMEPAALPPARNRGVLVYLPTGGGKTRVALEVALTEIAARGTVLFVVNRDTLAVQAFEAFNKAPELRGRIALLTGNSGSGGGGVGGSAREGDAASDYGTKNAAARGPALVTVATIQTLHKRFFKGCAAAVATVASGVALGTCGAASGDVSGDSPSATRPPAELPPAEFAAPARGNRGDRHGPPPGASLVVLDECHGAAAASYLDLAAGYPRAP